jgi:hypothetical protein
MKYYQVQVQFTLDEGKKQKLAYLVDAESCIEAETNTVKHLMDAGEHNFEVKSVAESKIVDVIYVLTETKINKEEE